MDEMKNYNKQLDLFSEPVKQRPNVIEKASEPVVTQGLVINMHHYFSKQNEDKIQRLADKLTAHLQ